MSSYCYGGDLTARTSAREASCCCYVTNQESYRDVLVTTYSLQNSQSVWRLVGYKDTRIHGYKDTKVIIILLSSQ